MAVITNLKNHFKRIIENGGNVIKVTKDVYYILDWKSNDKERYIKEWFEKFSPGTSHASRDQSMVRGADNIIEAKFLTLEDIDKLQEPKEYEK